MKDTQEYETEISLTYGSLAKSSKLIRSLRDDEPLNSQEPGMPKWLRVHDDFEWSLDISLMLRCWEDALSNECFHSSVHAGTTCFPIDEV